MIQITESAQAYFRKLIEQQDGAAIGIRLSAMRPGTPSADARLEFCDVDDLVGDEWAVDCDGFTLYVDGASVPYFDGAEVDFLRSDTGGQVTIRAPRIKGVAPAADAGVIERDDYAITGYLGRGEGLLVHTADCHVGRRLFERDSERWIHVEWAEEVSRNFETAVDLMVRNGKGVLAQVAQAIANAEADITHIDMGEERATDHARMRLLVNVRDRLQLAEVLRP